MKRFIKLLINSRGRVLMMFAPIAIIFAFIMGSFYMHNYLLKRDAEKNVKQESQEERKMQEEIYPYEWKWEFPDEWNDVPFFPKIDNGML